MLLPPLALGKADLPIKYDQYYSANQASGIDLPVISVK